MRDWLARSLDEEANIIKAQSAVICQAVVRMGFSRNVYSREIAARDIQSCARALNLTKPFSALRQSTLSILPEARGVIARAVAAQAYELNTMSSNRAAMVAFLEDNVSLALKEADERRMMRAEDEYGESIAYARFGERISGLKSDAIRAAELAYSQAKERIQGVFDVVESMNAKSAEIDARWAKMQSEGVVRSVPLVRQYKANAAPFYPPAKDAYKFRYSFTYKGSQEPEPPAPVPVASAKSAVTAEVEVSSGGKSGASIEVDVSSGGIEVEASVGGFSVEASFG